MTTKKEEKGIDWMGIGLVGLSIGVHVGGLYCACKWSKELYQHPETE